ncbi:MAG: amidohydrolase family protein [Pseudomonadota bacterium]
MKFFVVIFLSVFLMLFNISSSYSEDKTSKWDVNTPNLSTQNIPIKTQEGTWLNLSVHPSGKRIVFDMLGDLYELPINGGLAKPLTQSLAWEMQPRYSPDGTKIAFTSDAEGGDNIWVMNADGTTAKAITNEKFRLLNNASWSPDSQFLVARKHYTGTRSLGAGEIWLYHINGGKGVQLIKRPNDQKDLGEPIFSADGESVYYSQDTTPGQYFEYSKNSNSQIYEIKAVNRITGDVDTIISGSGGAVRPSPSPNGQYLAFVRRIRDKTALFLKNLETSEEYPIYDELDRDMQETWAIHGVYSNMDWTPDSRNIIFWAKGKIQRINVQSLKVDEIPFTVNHTKKVAEALRFPVEVWSPNYSVKMPRWLTMSPNKKRMVFQALGKLYIQDTNAGEARRLTKQHSNFEMYPTFSNDSRYIVYTTWNDQNLGSIYLVSASGGTPRKLTQKPGHYIEPVIDPAGKWVYYRAIRNSALTAPKYNQKLGLYRIPLSGESSAPELISKQGFAPTFASDQALYYSQSHWEKAQHWLQLKRMDLTTRQTRVIAKSPFGTEFKLSPDGKWLSYINGFSVYLSPITPTNQAIELGANHNALPTYKVSKEAGDNLHWSSDSQRLYWSLGPTLFEKELPRLTQDLPDFEKKASKEYAVKLNFKADNPNNYFALEGARIITMNGDEVIENGTIITRGNKIVAVGKKSALKAPSTAYRINLSGKTIIPGLVDVHWHGSQGNQQIIPQQNWVNLASLAFGITTLHDPSNDTLEIFAARELQLAGKIVAPRIFSTGTILYGAKTPFTANVDSLEDARFHIKRMKAVGAISVKSYNQPRRDQRQQILVAAREEKMMVLPEGGSLMQHNLTMIADGHTGIEHALPVANIYEDIRQFWQQTKVSYTPTMGVAYGGIWGEHYWYHHTEVWKHPLLTRYVPAHILEARSVRRVMAPEEDYNHFAVAKIAAELQDLGVGVQLGAHGQREGLAAHWEMWMFEQGGMTPLEVIQASTIDGAKYLGMENHIGSLVPGKLADLVILDHNPLENLRKSDKVHAVMLNGRLYDSETMNEIGPYIQKRAPFYWE